MGRATKTKLVDAYYTSLREFCAEMLTRAHARGARVRELQVYWFEQAPHPARIYNLKASALIDGTYVQLVDEPDGITLPVDIPTAEIRACFRRHPRQRGFFINAHPNPDFDLAPAEVKRAVTRLEKWFVAKSAGLPDGHQNDIAPAYEFDWVMFLMIDACIEHLGRDLAKESAFKKAGLVLTGDGGDRNETEYNPDEIRTYRESNGYTPTRAFLREYISLFSGNPAFIAYWVATLDRLPGDQWFDPYAKCPHPSRR